MILCLSLARMNHPSLTRLYKILSLLGQRPQVYTTCQFSCVEKNTLKWTFDRYLWHIYLYTWNSLSDVAYWLINAKVTILQLSLTLDRGSLAPLLYRISESHAFFLYFFHGCNYGSLLLYICLFLAFIGENRDTVKSATCLLVQSP